MSAIDFSRSKDVDKLRTETKNYADNILDYITGKDHDGSLKEGKLLEVDDRDIIDRHYFTIQTSILWTNANFRLKGYTATTYNNNRWEQISNYDEYSDLFDRIKEKGYNFGAVNGTLLETYQGRFEYEYSKLHFYDFRRAKNYVYQTYCQIVEKDQAPYKNDLGLAAKNKYDYTYTSYLGDMHMYDITKSELYKDAEFSKLWKEYGEFVKAEYSASYVADSVRELVDGFGAESRNQLIDKVRTYLEENTEYSHKFNKCPKNKDFVEYFLFDEMRGYSTHYATAAAVMLQSQGYPARYVEGYFLPKSVVNASFIDEEGNLVIDVTDTYAHAWIEIYDSTYGCIPVEVTPGYWSGMFQEELESQINDKPTDSEQQQTKPNKTPNKDDKDDTKLDPNSSNVDNNLGNQFVGGMGGISGGRALTPAEIAVIVVIAVIIFAIIAWILFHYIYAFVRKKKLHSDNTNKIINAAYKYFIKLASYEGIDCKNIYSYMAFADRCSENSRHLDKKQNAKFFAILLKNAFSESGASKEEAKLCAEYVIRYSQVIYKDLSAYKKFVFKMIKQL